MTVYHRLTAQPKPLPVAINGGDPQHVAVLIDKFLDYFKKNLAADTYEWYQSRLQVWCDKYPDLTVGELKN